VKDLPPFTIPPGAWKDRLTACILGGAVGDAWGSGYENIAVRDEKPVFYYGRLPSGAAPEWRLTDDTQLTLITADALLSTKRLQPDALAARMLEAHRRHAITGLGAATLKALTDLNMGIHWSLAGRSGEYAAGNGAAMRIATVAFWNRYSRDEIRDFCRISHRNDEAYCGALAIVLAIRLLLSDARKRERSEMLRMIAGHLPDTAVRDRLLLIAGLSEQTPIAAAARLGAGGYVVDSIPLAIFSALQAADTGFEETLRQLIACGGDTDTNASLAGQIMGTALGSPGIPAQLTERLRKVRGYHAIAATIARIGSYDAGFAAT